MNIFISGLLAYDKIMDYPERFADHILPDKIHQLNVSFVAKNLSEHFGGTAGNIAYNLALLGEKPVLIGAGGKDFGVYKTHLEKHGVDLKFVRMVADKATAFITILTDKGNNQIAVVYPGTFDYASQIKAEDVKGVDVAIVTAGNLEDMRVLPEFYREHNIKFIYDPAQEIPLLSGDDLKEGFNGAYALMSNDYELSLILEKTGLTEADILDKVQVLVTTLGEKGSVIKTKNETLVIPAAKVEKPLDPTGAGDAYRAGFIKGLSLGWPLPLAGRFASVVAAYAVEVYGSQSQLYSLEDAQKRFQQNFGEILSPKIN